MIRITGSGKQRKYTDSCRTKQDLLRQNEVVGLQTGLWPICIAVQGTSYDPGRPDYAFV